MRTDILRKPEIDTMLDVASNVWNGERLQCIIALAWLFGKRISEIMKLRRGDVRVDEHFLHVRFYVGKKEKKEPVPKPFWKMIRREHPYVPYVLNWVKDFDVEHPEFFLFPSDRGESTHTVRYVNKEGKEVTYEYKTPGGYLSTTRVYQQLKKINPNAWWHLFRESLATYMAENGAHEEDLMHWFDWNDPKTAHEYVKHGTAFIEKWAVREF